MNTPSHSSAEPWYARPKVTRTLLVILGLVLLVEGYLAIFVRRNDFAIHYDFGRDFLAGNPYIHGQLHYPLGRSMWNALTAWMNYRAARAVYFVVAVTALTLVLRKWLRVADGAADSSQTSLAAALWSVVILVPFLVRDLDECGLQLILLGFLTAGLAALLAGRPIASGFWLALALTYKVTPAIFFPYLLWKRQFRAAASMAGCALLLNLAPALYLGWDATIACHRQWAGFAVQCLSNSDPSETGVEAPRHLNQSLPFAIARFCQTHPPGHPLSLADPAFVQFADLDGPTTKHVIQIVLLGLAGVLAWRFRKPWRDGDAPANLGTEWAAVTILCALLSPLCWTQHLVLVLPALLLCVQAVVARRASPWHVAGLAAVVPLLLLVHGDILGDRLYTLALAYKLHTLAALLLVAMVVTLVAGRQRVRDEVLSQTIPADSWDEMARNTLLPSRRSPIIRNPSSDVDRL